MYKILLTSLTLTASLAQAQTCVLQQQTQSSVQAVISEVRNIKADVINLAHGQKKCTVALDGLVKGQWLRAFGEHTFENETNQIACGVAVEVAKKNLLVRVNSSTIKSESVLICRDDVKPKVVSTQLGSVIEDITQLRPHPTYQQTFYHQGQECRWFVEASWVRDNVKPINGIVCRLSPRQWVVIDKF